MGLFLSAGMFFGAWRGEAAHDTRCGGSKGRADSIRLSFRLLKKIAPA
jgi:hypothetical protein